MSTRSGKRIHNSFHENIILKPAPEMELVAKSERKTRSKRMKENIEDVIVDVVKSKRRTNYVSYPVGSSVEEENASDTADSKEESKTSRTLRKNALKERNFVTPIETMEPSADVRKSIRTTRRTRKFPEEVPEDSEEQNVEQEVVEAKPKKGKKKKIVQEPEEETVTKKKSKKKKGRGSGPIIVEVIEPEKKALNKSTVSNDSFHSAAGSPSEDSPVKTVKCPDQETTAENNQTEGVLKRRTRSISKANGTLNISNEIKLSRKRKTSTKEIDKSIKETELVIEHQSKKRKSLAEPSEVKNTTFELENARISIINTTLEKPGANTTFEKDSSKLDTDKTVNDTTFDKIEEIVKIQRSSGKKSLRKSIINTTYEKSANNSLIESNIRKSVINTTYEKTENDSVQDIEMKSSTQNETFDKKSNSTFDKIEKLDSTFDKKSESNSTFDKVKSNSTFEKKSDSTFDKTEKLDFTFDKEKSNSTFEKKSNSTFDKIEKLDSTFDKEKSNSTFDKSEKLDFTFDKEKFNLTLEKKSNFTFDKKSNSTFGKIEKLDSTFDKEKSNSTFDKKSNSTFDKTEKLHSTFEKNSKCSLLSSDNSVDKSNITLDKSDVSRISITSDESKENIVNTTPVLIESSLDESEINQTNVVDDSAKLSPKKPCEDSNLSKPSTPTTSESPVVVSTSKISVVMSTPITPEDPTAKSPVTPLKREGTFTKDSPAKSPKPSLTKSISLPSPGCTPFPNKSATKDRPMMNVTRSIEKSRRSTLAEPLPRMTKVMFCSPVNNPAVVMQQRRKVIKSNLKGSNKSFVFDDSVSAAPEARAAPRKRSYTHNDAEEARVKRSRLAHSVQRSVDRMARSRTCSATGKLGEPTTPSKKTPSKTKPVRTKLPNFAALHQREFDKMESLDECQQRRARRARQMLTPTGSVSLLERTSPRENTPDQTKPDSQQKPKDKETKPAKQPKEKKPKETKKPETPVKSLPTFKSLNPGYTRFGFKLNLDANPFSVPSTISRSEGNLSTKKDGIFQFSSKKDEFKLKRQVTAPSLAGTTSARREAAKQTVMREKSFSEKRREKRNENRTVIKGVRTNRRFELQMRMRNLD